MSGKGMAPRKGYNQQRYAENYDGIFRRTQKTMKNYDNKTNRVLPWHVEAAKAVCNHADLWYRGPGKMLPDGTFGEQITSIISSRDPHLETARLLEQAMYTLGTSPLCSEINDHLIKLKGTLQ